MLYKPNDADILMRAADLIESRGHAKGVLKDENGGLCINGALLEAMGVNVLTLAGYSYQTSELFHRLSDRVSRLVPPGLNNNGHIDWNNAPERTKEEIVAKLREVAGAYEHA